MLRRDFLLWFFRATTLLIICFAVAACSSQTPGNSATLSETSAGTESGDNSSSPSPLASLTLPPATTEPTYPSPTETSVPTAPPVTAFAPTNDLSIGPSDVIFFPVPEIYTGDLVTIQIAPNVPHGLAPNDVDVQVLLDGHNLLTGNLNWRKLSGDTVGLFQWAWDTTNSAGSHTITVVVDPDDAIQINDENPDNNQVNVRVTVRPRSELSKLEQEAAWVVSSNTCCNVHTVSGTAAQRDLEQLLALVDEAFQQAATRLNELLAGPYDVYFIDRVVGQGGYAMDAMVISYLDRDYAGGGLQEVLIHEATHLIDRQFAPKKITFLSEGLAVVAAGGHYQQEDLSQRTAALMELGRYVPLAEVIDDFYVTHHEISYLEAAGFLEYLIQSYGWPRVQAFYSQATADDGESLSAAIDTNLQRAFGVDLEQTEAEWLAYLRTLPRERETLNNLRLTLEYYDLMRRYQVAYDPTAYYLYAWLPGPEEAERRKATSDFTRHPESMANITLEAMLTAANSALLSGDYNRAEALLDSVRRVLDNRGQFLDPLAKSYFDIALVVSEAGYEAQQVEITGERADVKATRPGNNRLLPLQVALERNQEWTLIR